MPVWAKKAGGLLAVLFIVAAIAGYVWYDRHLRFFEETNDATIQADQVAISSKLAGYVREVPVADNQRVARGALLVRIDPLDYQTRLAAADAEIISARAAELAARASRSETEAAITGAQAALKAAQAGLDFADRELARYRPLVARGIEPAEKLSSLRAAREKAQAEVEAQRAAVVQAERKTQSSTAQTAQVAARLETARVQRQAAANDVDATRLAAPVAGRVANRTVRVGQFVQPGMRLMTLVPSDELYVVANFKETQLGLMRAGQPVRIRVDALPGIEFGGAVASVTPGTGANFSLIPPQNATGNFTKIVQRVPVRIRIDAGPAARKVLVPGLSLVVEVDTRSGERDIDAIRSEQERASK